MGFPWRNGAALRRTWAPPPNPRRGPHRGGAGGGGSMRARGVRGAAPPVLRKVEGGRYRSALYSAAAAHKATIRAFMCSQFSRFTGNIGTSAGKELRISSLPVAKWRLSSTVGSKRGGSP